MEERAKTLSDYAEVLKRRKCSLVLPILFIFVISAVIALTLPPVYKSTSTILIEQQEIPPDFVMATVTSYAEQRLQTIRQRIMSSSRLLDIINRFDLYRDLRGRWTTEEIIEKMREDIKLETISPEVVDQRTGKATKATIAFTLSYEGENPDLVHRVANVLASLFLEENLQVREKQAVGASTFLEEEMKGVKGQLAEIEAKIAAFKKSHVNELPELLQVNLQSLDRIEREIERVNDQIRSMREREGYLQSQLSSIPQSSTEEKNRLDQLRTQMAFLKARFSDEHPDVVKTRAEIAELEKRLGASLSGEKGADKKEGSSGSKTVNVEVAENPAYITLAAQLTSTQVEIESLNRQLKEILKSRNEYRRRIEATPKVEEAYRALTVERDNTQAKYSDLLRKFMEARVAHGLEKEQKGERFTLIDPARFPEKQDRPNRLAILLIGLVLGIGAGVGTASVREYSDQSVRSPEGLMRDTAFPVLAAIPEIVTKEDLARRTKRRWAVAIGAAGFILLGLLVLHFLIMDLGILWAKLLRRMAL